MRPVDAVTFKNISANTSTFALQGGLYGIAIIAGAWNAGSANILILQADGSSLRAAGVAATANNYQVLSLPPGQYQLAITAATGVYASVTRIPWKD